LALLLPSIPLSRWVVPGLHLKLGLSLAILNLVLIFVSEYVERQSESVKEALVLLGEKDRILQESIGRRDAFKDARPKPPPDVFSSTMKDFAAEIKVQRGARTHANNKLKTARRKQKNKPVEQAIEAVLLKYGVARQVYHSHALIGEHANRMLEFHDPCITGFEKAMLDGALRRPAAELSEGIDEEITALLSKVYDMMEVLDVIVHYLEQTEPLSAEDRANFCDFNNYFGHLWRNAFPSTQVPPKLHILESHAAAQMDLWHVLGLFSESPIERHHNLMNRWNRIFANMRTFKQRVTAQHKHMSKIANHDVQSIIANITTATKRTVSAVSAQRKVEKEVQHLAGKKRKVEEVKGKVEKEKSDEDDEF
jgi:hypothetical protein